MPKKKSKPSEVKLMGQVKIWFYKEKGIGAMLDRFFWNSHWNHVGVEIDGKITIIDYQKGVINVSKEQLLGVYPKATFTFIPVPEIGKGQWFLDRQLNKPEDDTFKGLFNNGRRWDDDEKWTGAELAAEVLRRCGIVLNLPRHRVTPSDLWRVMPIITFNPNSGR